MIKRIKDKETFIYLNDGEKMITDQETLERIDSLKIPPAWTEVSISPKTSDRIQAFGFDKKGRKQCIYHPDFLKKNNLKKFKKLRCLFRVLPFLRERVTSLVKQNRWTREKCLAVAVLTLDKLSIRIGNRCYLKENGSYGLTTLEKRHLVKEKGSIYLRFRGKSNKDQNILIDDPELVRLLRSLHRLPGKWLFQYKTKEGELKPLESSDVNEFLRDTSGETITAKDFRTLRATVLALSQTEATAKEVKKTKRTKLLTQVVKKVSGTLGNTLAICKNYYIHPRVVQLLETEKLPRYLKKLKNRLSAPPAMLTDYEHLAASLLYGM